MAGWLVPAGVPWVFYLAFSVPVGLGCAFLYPSVASCAQKWYAEKKGLATGVIGGAGAFRRCAHLPGALFYLAGGHSRRISLAGRTDVYGVCRRLRPVGKPAGKAAADAQQSGARNYTAGQMLKTKQYWLLFFVVALATPAVLLFSPIIVELGQQRGLSGGGGAQLHCGGQHGQCGGPPADALAVR